MSLLGIVAVALVIVILFQISKAGEILGELGGEKKMVDANNRFQANMFLWVLIFGLIGIVWSAFHYSPMFLPEASSEHGVGIQNMYFWTLVSIVPIFFLTQILLFGFSYFYRRDDRKAAFYFPESNKLELIWSLIPAVVMVLLVTGGLRQWLKITGPIPEELAEEVLTIEATAQQFKWDIRYSGKDKKLGPRANRKMSADNPWGQDWTDPANQDDFIPTEVYLPVNRPVMVKINSLDVLHSFYLPHFKVKMDAVPGIPTQFWFTPTKTSAQMQLELDNPEFIYELACAELCGKAHYNMRKEVFVVEQDEFDAWMDKQESLYSQFAKPTKSAEVDTEKEEKSEKSEKEEDVEKTVSSL